MSSYNIRYVFEAVDKVSGVMSNISSNVEKSQRTFSAFRQVGATVTAAGVAMAGGLGFAVKKAAEFDSAMSEVKAISGASGKEFKQLETKAREMGATTSFSASEAAEGMKYMALAGWDTKQIMGGIGPVLHLAEAGALDLGRASDLVTDSMAAMGLEVKDLPKYLDQVAQTSRKSNTDIDALMEAFVIAGGTFRQFNVPTAEAAAMLGVLANRGFKGAEAGTAMNAIMSNLTSGTGQAGKAMEKLGISAFDADGNFKGLETVLLEVKEKLAGMTEEQQAHFIAMLAGKDHMKTFQSLLNGLGEEYTELKGDITDSNGALKEMRDEMKNNLQGALENLSSAFDEMAISIGHALMPAIEFLVSVIQSLVDWFNGLDEGTKTLIATTAALAATFLLLSGPVLLFIGFLPHLIQGFQSLKLVMNGVKLAVLALTSPWALIIAAALAAVVLLIVYWEPIKEFFVDLWESIKELGVSIWESLKEKWSEAVEFFVSVWEGVKEFFSLLWAGMLEVASMVWENLKEVWSETVSFFRELWEGVKEFFINLWDTVVEASVEIWEGFKGTLSNIWNGIMETAVTIWEGMKTAIAEIWNAIKENIFERLIGIATNVSEKFTEVKETIKTKISEAKEALVQKFVEMVTNATTKAQEILQNVRAKFTEVKTAVQDRITQAKDVLVNKFTEMYTNATAKAQSILQSVRGRFTQVKTAVQEKITQAKEALVNKFSEMVSSTISKGAEIVRAAKDKFNEVKNGIRDKLTEAVRVVGEKTGEMPGKVREKASNMVSAGKDLIKGLINGIKSMKNAAIEAITGVVNGVVKKAKSLLKIKSPSRVMIEIGEFTGEGLAKGIDAMVGDIEKASVDMAIAATPDIPPVEMSYTTPDVGSSAVKYATPTTAKRGSLEDTRQKQPVELKLMLGDSTELARYFISDINDLQGRQLTNANFMRGVKF